MSAVAPLTDSHIGAPLMNTYISHPSYPSSSASITRSHPPVSTPASIPAITRMSNGQFPTHRALLKQALQTIEQAICTLKKQPTPTSILNQNGHQVPLTTGAAVVDAIQPPPQPHPRKVDAANDTSIDYASNPSSRRPSVQQQHHRTAVDVSTNTDTEDDVQSHHSTSFTHHPPPPRSAFTSLPPTSIVPPKLQSLLANVNAPVAPTDVHQPRVIHQSHFQTATHQTRVFLPVNSESPMQHHYPINTSSSSFLMSPTVNASLGSDSNSSLLHSFAHLFPPKSSERIGIDEPVFSAPNRGGSSTSNGIRPSSFQPETPYVDILRLHRLQQNAAVAAAAALSAARPSTAYSAPMRPVVMGAVPASTTSLSSFARSLQLQRQQLERLDDSDDEAALRTHTAAIRKPATVAPSSIPTAPSVSVAVPSFSTRYPPSSHILTSSITHPSPSVAAVAHRSREDEQDELEDISQHDRAIARLKQALMQPLPVGVRSTSPMNGGGATQTPTEYQQMRALARATEQRLERTFDLVDSKSNSPSRLSSAPSSSFQQSLSRSSSPPPLAVRPIPIVAQIAPIVPIPSVPSELDLKIQSTQQRAAKVLQEVDETLGRSRRREEVNRSHNSAAAAVSVDPSSSPSTWSRLQAEMQLDEDASRSRYASTAALSSFAQPSPISPLRSTYASATVPALQPARELMAQYLQQTEKAKAEVLRAAVAASAATSIPSTTMAGTYQKKSAAEMIAPRSPRTLIVTHTATVEEKKDSPTKQESKLEPEQASHVVDQPIRPSTPPSPTRSNISSPAASHGRFPVLPSTCLLTHSVTREPELEALAAPVSQHHRDHSIETDTITTTDLILTTTTTTTTLVQQSPNAIVTRAVDMEDSIEFEEESVSPAYESDVEPPSDQKAKSEQVDDTEDSFERVGDEAQQEAVRETQASAVPSSAPRHVASPTKEPEASCDSQPRDSKAQPYTPPRTLVTDPVSASDSYSDVAEDIEEEVPEDEVEIESESLVHLEAPSPIEVTKVDRPVTSPRAVTPEVVVSPKAASPAQVERVPSPRVVSPQVVSPPKATVAPVEKVPSPKAPEPVVQSTVTPDVEELEISEEEIDVAPNDEVEFEIDQGSLSPKLVQPRSPSPPPRQRTPSPPRRERTPSPPTQTHESEIVHDLVTAELASTSDFEGEIVDQEYDEVELAESVDGPMDVEPEEAVEESVEVSQDAYDEFTVEDEQPPVSHAPAAPASVPFASSEIDDGSYENIPSPTQQNPPKVAASLQQHKDNDDDEYPDFEEDEVEVEAAEQPRVVPPPAAIAVKARTPSPVIGDDEPIEESMEIDVASDAEGDREEEISPPITVKHVDTTTKSQPTDERDVQVSPLKSEQYEDEFATEAVRSEAAPLAATSEPIADTVISDEFPVAATSVDAAADENYDPPAVVADDGSNAAAADYASEGYYDEHGVWISAMTSQSVANQTYYDPETGQYYDPVTQSFWNDQTESWEYAPQVQQQSGEQTEQQLYDDGTVAPITASAQTEVVEEQIEDELVMEPQVQHDDDEELILEEPQSADHSLDLSSDALRKSSAPHASSSDSPSPRSKAEQSRLAASKVAFESEIAQIKADQDAADRAEADARVKEQVEEERRRQMKGRKRREVEQEEQERKRMEDENAASTAAAAKLAAEPEAPAAKLSSTASASTLDEEDDDQRDAAMEAEKSRQLAREAELDDDLPEDIDSDVDQQDESVVEDTPTRKRRAKEELVEAITMSLLQDLTRDSLTAGSTTKQSKPIAGSTTKPIDEETKRVNEVKASAKALAQSAQAEHARRQSLTDSASSSAPRSSPPPVDVSSEIPEDEIEVVPVEEDEDNYPQPVESASQSFDTSDLIQQTDSLLVESSSKLLSGSSAAPSLPSHSSLRTYP